VTSDEKLLAVLPLCLCRFAALFRARELTAPIRAPAKLRRLNGAGRTVKFLIGPWSGAEDRARKDTPRW
jgi:hypothetical protein